MYLRMDTALTIKGVDLTITKEGGNYCVQVDAPSVPGRKPKRKISLED